MNTVETPQLFPTKLPVETVKGSLACVECDIFLDDYKRTQHTEWLTPEQRVLARPLRNKLREGIAEVHNRGEVVVLLMGDEVDFINRQLINLIEATREIGQTGREDFRRMVLILDFPVQGREKRSEVLSLQELEDKHMQSNSESFQNAMATFMSLNRAFIAAGGPVRPAFTPFIQD